MHKLLLTLFAAGVVCASPAWAEGGDTLRGQAYAHGMCASCHSIGADGAASPNPKASPFKTIQMNYASGEELSTRINTKHPPFGPNLLNPKQAEDILAYVATLRPKQSN